MIQSPIALFDMVKSKLLFITAITTAAVLTPLTVILAEISATSLSSPIPNAEALRYKGVEKEFYLNNMDNPKINETLAGIPADMFNIPEMTVKKGDTVIIHFLNVEPEVSDRHSFTIDGSPYATNVSLDGGQNKTITFVANQTGIFKYYCIYHMPSMTGQLVVSPVTLDEFRAQQGQK